MEELSCKYKTKETIRRDGSYCNVCSRDIFNIHGSIGFDLGQYGFYDLVSNFYFENF